MTDTASAAPTYQQIVASWNARADHGNQWDALGEDEKIEWAVACAKAAPPAVVPIGWYVTGCSRILDEHDAKAEARQIGGSAKALPLYTAPAVVEPLTADGMKEPKNGQHWRVEWWNESCRMMLPTNKKLDHFQSFKNGTLMLTIKQAAHGIGIKKGDSHG